MVILHADRWVQAFCGQQPNLAPLVNSSSNPQQRPVIFDRTSQLRAGLASVGVPASAKYR